METREITEYKTYILCLADMHGGVDKSKPVAVFSELELLRSYYQSQLADAPWQDAESPDNYGNVHKWHKVFKKGSPLEWYNPLTSFDIQSWQDVAFGGVIENWSSSYPEQDTFTVPFNPK